MVNDFPSRNPADYRAVGRTGRYVYVPTGETISRRQYMNLQISQRLGYETTVSAETTVKRERKTRRGSRYGPEAEYTVWTKRSGRGIVRTKAQEKYIKDKFDALDTIVIDVLVDFNDDVKLQRNYKRNSQWLAITADRDLVLRDLHDSKSMIEFVEKRLKMSSEVKKVLAFSVRDRPW